MPVGVVVAEDVVGAGDDAGRATGAEPRGHDFGEQLGPLRLLGWHRPTIFGPPGHRSDTVRRCPRSSKSSATGPSPRRRCGGGSTKVWMVDARYGRGGTTPRRLRARAGRPHLHRGAAPGQAHAARHRRRPDPRRPLRHDRRAWWSTARRRSTGCATGPGCSTRSGCGPASPSPTAAPAPVHDPRRFGSLELAPDESRLGPDALTVTLAELRHRPGGATGHGRSGGAPQGPPHGPGAPGRRRQPAGRRDPVAGRPRPAAARRRSATTSCASCTGRCARRCASSAAAAVRTWATSWRSATPAGAARSTAPSCAVDTVGGRTTYWCPVHQH